MLAVWVDAAAPTGARQTNTKIPNMMSRLCAGRISSASNVSLDKKDVMDVTDLRKKADGLADIAAQVDCWLSDVPESLSDWFEVTYGTDMNELSRLWQVVQDMRDVAKRHIRLECENPDCWNNPLPGADHKCRTCGMWVCDECWQTCDECGDGVCTRCVRECGRCGALVCERCAMPDEQCDWLCLSCDRGRMG